MTSSARDTEECVQRDEVEFEHERRSWLVEQQAAAQQKVICFKQVLQAWKVAMNC